jgi:hypothetical protein
MVSKIWRFLTTDITEFNWKRSTESVKAGADAVKGLLDLGKTCVKQSMEDSRVLSSVKAGVGDNEMG